MSEKKDNIKIVRFESFYKALNPNITTAKGGVEFFNSDNTTEDNAMPQKLLDLKTKSSIHSHFLNLKASLINASGLFPVDDTNSTLSEYLKTENRAGDSIQKVFKKATIDMATYEQCFVEVIYSANGKIAEIYHKPFNTIRAGECNEYGVPDRYFYSKTWGEITNIRNRKRRFNDTANAVPIDAFNPERFSESGGKQILHIKKYDSTDGVYTIPSYLAAEYWINLVYLVGQYVHNKFQNGYFMQGFLYLPSNASPEDQDKFVREFRQKHQGTNGDTMVFVFGDTNVQKPEFVPIQDALNNSVFKEYMGEATKQICFAHGSGLHLLGLSNSDSFGSSNADSNDINVARMEYVANVIKSFQEDLLEGFNRIFAVNGLGSATLLNETLKLTIPELLPEDTTRSERREIVLGLNEHPEDSIQTDNNPNVNLPQ